MKKYISFLCWLIISCPVATPVSYQLTGRFPQFSIKVEVPKPVQQGHIIGSFSTKFQHIGKYTNRAFNIETNVLYINGHSIAPGAQFSFNETVGPRTAENGFRKAPTLFLGELKDEFGGGTCQVSSTLHAAALLAGLKIIKRTPHSRASTYIGKGLDATVAYPDLDLVIQNPYSTSVFIYTSIEINEEHPDVEYGLVITIQGTEPAVVSSYKWHTLNTEPYTKRFRKTNEYRNAHKKRTQSGRDGEEGVLTIKVNGVVSKYTSHYFPVPEVWEVGLAWDMSVNPWDDVN